MYCVQQYCVFLLKLFNQRLLNLEIKTEMAEIRTRLKRNSVSSFVGDITISHKVLYQNMSCVETMHISDLTKNNDFVNDRPKPLDFCCIFGFLFNVLYFVVCPFVLFCLVIVLSIILQFTASEQTYLHHPLTFLESLSALYYYPDYSIHCQW